MAKQFQVEENETEAVAREIFVATAIQTYGKLTPEFVVEKAFDYAEAFIAHRKKRRQPSNNQKSLTGEPCNAQESTVRP